MKKILYPVLLGAKEEFLAKVEPNGGQSIIRTLFNDFMKLIEEKHLTDD